MTGLCWESFRPCSYAIGRTVADLVLVTGRGGLLEDVEVVLDDGGRLFLGNRDAWPARPRGLAAAAPKRHSPYEATMPAR